MNFKNHLPHEFTEDTELFLKNKTQIFIHSVRNKIKTQFLVFSVNSVSSVAKSLLFYYIW